MSIYISGMEIPKDRPKLLWVYPNGKVITVKSDIDPEDSFQAVHIPEHGRLGDLDALKAKAIERSEKCGVSVNVLDRVITAFDIETAPTIVPADRA